MADEELRAYKFALDLTDAQLSLVRQHAGAARWAFNHALAIKLAAREQWLAGVKALEESGLDAKAAKAQAPKVKIPSKPDIQKALNVVKGDDRVGVEGACPWWHTVSTYAFQSAMIDADRAWQNWMDSLTGKRAGRAAGFPRFKAKNRCRDSFRIHHHVGNPTIRPDSGYRRIVIPRLGSLRVHDSTKRLRRALDRGAVINSVTISRGGHRWYASVLTKTENPITAPTTRRQREAGIVGVDLGVNHMAALSTGELIANPRILKAANPRLKKAQRALSRTQKGSNRRSRAARRVGRIHHEIAERRATNLHHLTKRLATGWQVIAVEDLNVAGMTASAKGTVDKPGRNVKAKSGTNRSLLDVSPGEFRRQLEYKTHWYGSRLAVIDRWFPSSQICSACGARAKLPRDERVYRCASCGLVLDRDVNAAINIAAKAVVSSDSGESLTALLSGPSDDPSTIGGRGVAADVEAGRPPDPGRAVTSTRKRVGHPPQTK
jgi:putative transposase